MEAATSQEPTARNPRPGPAPDAPPAPGTYTRVLRKYGLDRRHRQNFNGYNFKIMSLNVDMYGEIAHTLFFPAGKEPAADRAAASGWKDETKRWAAFLAGETDPKVIRQAEKNAAADAVLARLAAEELAMKRTRDPVTSIRDPMTPTPEAPGLGSKPAAPGLGERPQAGDLASGAGGPIAPVRRTRKATA